MNLSRCVRFQLDDRAARTAQTFWVVWRINLLIRLLAEHIEDAQFVAILIVHGSHLDYLD